MSCCYLESLEQQIAPHMQAGHGCADQCAACCLRACKEPAVLLCWHSACGPESMDEPTRHCTCMQRGLPHTSSKDVRSMWGFCLRLDGVSLSTARRAKGQTGGADRTPGLSASAYCAPAVHSLQNIICKSTHIRGSGLRWGPRDLPCCVHLL